MRLICLYPRAWRDRYGDEFDALLAQARAGGFRDLIDLLNGAVVMRIRTGETGETGTS